MKQTETKIFHGVGESGLVWVATALKAVSDAANITHTYSASRPPVEEFLVYKSATGYFFDYGLLYKTSMTDAGRATLQGVFVLACVSINYEMAKAGHDPVESPEVTYTPLKTVAYDDPAHKMIPTEGMVWDVEERQITTLTGETVTIKLALGEKPVQEDDNGAT